MKDLTIAVGLHYGLELYRDRERAAVVARLMLDKRWPRRFAKWQVYAKYEVPKPRRGYLPKPDPESQIAAAIADPTTVWVRVETQAGEEVCVDVGNLRESYPPHRRPNPYRTVAHVYTKGLRNPAKQVGDWVTVVHDLARAVEARNGVIVVHADSTVALRDRGGPSIPAEHDHLDIIGGGTAGAEARNQLGVKYALYPRWGTYLHAGHVEAIGGRARIAEVVRPAVMEDVGDLLYVQLTVSIEDAWTPEMWAKRLALRELMAPILVPK